MSNIIIRYAMLPDRINAITVPDECDNYNVYINQTLCSCQQEKALQHEMEHINKRDFESYCDVSELEKRVKEVI